MLPITSGLETSRDVAGDTNAEQAAHTSAKQETSVLRHVSSAWPDIAAYAPLSYPDLPSLELPRLPSPEPIGGEPDREPDRQPQLAAKADTEGEGVAESGGRGSPSHSAQPPAVLSGQYVQLGHDLEPATSSHTAGKRQFEEVDDVDEESKHSAQKAPKKPRLVWTPELHARFMNAVNHLGVKNAVPKTILQLMNVEGMTRENVASHLQKYRLYLKRLSGYPPNARVPAETLQQAQEQAMHHQAQQAALQHNFNLVQGMGSAAPFGMQPMSYVPAGVPVGVPQAATPAAPNAISTFPTFSPAAGACLPGVATTATIQPPSASTQPEPITTSQLFYPSWVPPAPPAGHTGFLTYHGGGVPVIGAQGLPQVIRGYGQQMQGWDWSKPAEGSGGGQSSTCTLPSIPQLDVGFPGTFHQDIQYK